jgi:probable phosphoglycerate mutase
VELGQGDWEGLTHEEVRALSPDVLDGWRRDPLRWNAPGGERLVDAATRVRGGVEAVAAALVGPPPPAARSPVLGYAGGAPDTEWTLLVAHDGIFRLALLALLGLPLDRFWAFPFVLCGITVLELRDGRASLIAHNLAAHLAPLAAEAVAETEVRDRAGAL